MEDIICFYQMEGACSSGTLMLFHRGPEFGIYENHSTHTRISRRTCWLMRHRRCLAPESSPFYGVTYRNRNLLSQLRCNLDDRFKYEMTC